MAEIGGRMRSCRPGDPEYDDDLYKGQLRRPWMIFNLGNRNEHLMTSFRAKLTGEMLREGILFDTHPLQCAQFRQSRRPLVESIQDGLRRCEEVYSRGPLSKPIVIVVSNAFGYMKHLFYGQIHLVKFSVRQFENTANGNLDCLKDRCSRLSAYLRQHEQLREGIAYPVPIGKSWRVPRNERGTASYVDCLTFNENIPVNFRRERCVAVLTETEIILNESSNEIIRRIRDPFQYIYQNVVLIVGVNYAVATTNQKCVSLRDLWIDITMENFITRIIPLFWERETDIFCHNGSVTLLKEIFKFFSIVSKIRPALLREFRRCVTGFIRLYTIHSRQTPWRSQTTLDEGENMEEIISSIESIIF